jgi:hypothetical protein
VSGWRVLPATAISAAQGLGGSRSSEREEKFLAERQRPARAAKKFSQEPLDREGGPDKLRAVAQQQRPPKADRLERSEDLPRQ